MIYSVTFFNPLGNCDNIAHVEADNEVDAALIAHADFWATSKPFCLSDYNVSEYSPEYVVKKEDIFEKGKKRDEGWTEEVFEEKKAKALEDYVLENWKYGYKNMKDGLRHLMDETLDKFGQTTGAQKDTRLLALEILSNAGELSKA
jgi:hypothetical protein